MAARRLMLPGRRVILAWASAATLSIGSLGGCSPCPDPTASSVVTVSLLPDEAQCPADGHCRVTAHVCVGGSTPNPAATASVHLSSGTWLVATEATDPTSISLPLGGGCGDAPFVVGTQVGPTLVQATVDTYTSASAITLTPAPVGHVSFSSAPLALTSEDGGSGNSLQLQLLVLPMAPGIALSQGTSVQLTIASTTPAGEQVIVEPDVSPVGATGTVAASVLAPMSVTEMVVEVTVLAIDGSSIFQQAYNITSLGP